MALKLWVWRGRGLCVELRSGGREGASEGDDGVVHGHVGMYVSVDGWGMLGYCVGEQARVAPAIEGWSRLPLEHGRACRASMVAALGMAVAAI